MKVYEFLTIDNQELIADKLYNYIVNHTDILKTKYDWNTLNLKEVLSFVPELVESCAKLVNHPIKMIAVIYRASGDDGKIHIDQGAAKYRLLMPVKNCQGTYTKFYDLNGNNVKELFNPNGNSYLTIEQTNPMPEIGCIELTQPIVFNSKIPHGVYTNPNLIEPRLSVTIGFNDYPIESVLMKTENNLQAS
jgi:hypothetical protein